MDSFGRYDSDSLSYRLDHVGSHQDCRLLYDLVKEPSVSSTVLQHYQSDDLICDAEIIKPWLNFCFSEHTEWRKPKLRASSRTIMRSFSLTLMHYKLAEILTSDAYIALSYVWGGVPQLNTTKANLEDLRKPHSLSKAWN